MAEKLGEAVLELRTDDSALNAGMAKAKAGAEDLGATFTSAGQRAGSSLSGLGSSAGLAGAAATKMAASAQLSARAAVGLAGDAQTATVAVTGLGNGSALATRELLVLAREAARGNFTRMAGSATILTTALQGSGQSIKGLVTNLLTMFGVMQTTTNAELAAEAAAASSAAAAVELAAKRAAANIIVADTELALAEAAVRNAATSTEATAAEERLAAANAAIAAAASEAAIAEDALSVAQGRASETAAAAATTTRTSYTALGAGLGIVTAGAVIAYGAFKAFQMQVSETGELDRFTQSLGLTKKQIDDLQDVTVTFGDVMAGVWKTVADHTGADDSIEGFKKFVIEQFELLLKAGVDIWSQLYGDIVGTYRAAIVIWQNFPAALGDVFYSAVNLAIGAIDKLLSASVSGVDGFIGKVNAKFGTHIGMLVAPQLSQVTNQYAGAAKKVISAIGVETTKATAEAKAAANAVIAETEKNILGATKKRIAAEETPPKAKKPKQPKKPKQDPADAELDKLDAQIAGENALTQAYLTSDAAVIKAEADQKALVLAVEKHATASQEAALKDRELALAIATIEADGAKAINNLTFEAAARKKVNDEVAAGLIPAAQMQQQLALEAELRPLLAAYDLADAAGKAKLAAEIKNLTDQQAALNAQNSRAQALQEEDANSDEIARLRLQVSLIGSSNRERAVALAQLEAEQKLKTMPGLSPAEQQQFVQSAKDKANASVLSPFQQWAQSVPQSADAINDALQSIEVKGFDGLSSAISGVITGTESLKSAFHNLAASILSDLIQMTIKMLIFKALQMALGGGSIGAPDIGSNMSTTLDTSVAPSLPFSGFHAMGGLIPSGMFGVVGENGPEPIIATPRGAMVLPNSSLRQGIVANDRAPSVSVTNYNDFRGADSAAVAAMSQRVSQMERDLPGRVVSTMQDARQRFVWRK